MSFILHHWVLMLSLLGSASSIGAFAWFLPVPALMVAKAIWSFLCHRSFWQLAFGAALLIGSVQTIRLSASVRHSRKVEAQLIKCSEAQRKLVEQSKAQQKQVTQVIEHYQTVEKPVVQKVVQRIESAPLPGHCRSPKEVLNADV